MTVPLQRNTVKEAQAVIEFTDLTLVCSTCLSADHEPQDIFTCSWCSGVMVEKMRLPADEQEKVWTQMVLC